MRRPLCIACILYVLGIALLQLLHPPTPPDYGSMVGKELSLGGRIYAKEFRNGEDSPILYLYLYSEELIFEEQNIPHNSNFICILEDAEELYANLKIGRTVWVHGKLSVYESATNPGQFDFLAYYGQKGIYGKITGTTVLSVSGTANPLSEYLTNRRHSLGERLESHFGKDDGTVLKAILLGDRAGMPEDLKTLYKDAGILHILAISGLHISMLSALLFATLRRLGISVGRSTFVCTLCMLFYGLMVGMPVSAARAILMFLYGLYARTFHRTADSPTILALSAAVILTVCPQKLFSSSFLLSFGAVSGIIFLKPALQKERKQPLFESLITSFSVFLFLLPLQLYFYYEISVTGIFLNLGVIPLMSVLVLLGILGLIPFGGIPLIGTGLETIMQSILRTGVHGILQAYKSGCETATWFNGAGIPGKPAWFNGILILGKPALWRVVFAYLLIGIFIFLRSHAEEWTERIKPHRKREYHLVCITILLLSYSLVMIPPALIEKDLRITFLDVGQGDCICVEFPGGGCFLFDGGSSSVNTVGKYRLIPYLKSRGIRKIDAVFISHGDQDHMNGVEELLSDGQIQIAMLVLPYGVGEDGSAEDFSSILELAEQKNVPVKTICANTSFSKKGTEFLCLNPNKPYQEKEANAYSQVFLVRYGSFSMLLTADIEDAGEEAVTEAMKDIMAKSGVDGVTVLKVAHHGSRYATSSRFLGVVNPNIAIISCAENNRYGHPHKEVLDCLEEFGAEVLRTDESGAITIKVSGGRVKISEMLNP